MRKEIQNNSGRNTKLLAQQESFSEFVQAFTLHHKDEFVYTAAFKKRANVLAPKDSDQFKAPNLVGLNRPCEIISGGAGADHRHVPYLASAVFLNLHQNDTVRNEKDVIDNQCKPDDQPIRCIWPDEGNCRRHDQTRKTYRLRQPADLGQWRQRRFGINTKQRQQNSPRWKDYCKMPKVNSDGHDSMSSQLKQRTKKPYNRVRRTQTTRQQKASGPPQQVTCPQIDGKYPFSLINHASSR